MIVYRTIPKLPLTATRLTASSHLLESWIPNQSSEPLTGLIPFMSIPLSSINTLYSSAINALCLVYIDFFNELLDNFRCEFLYVSVLSYQAEEVVDIKSAFLFLGHSGFQFRYSAKAVTRRIPSRSNSSTTTLRIW